MKTGISVSGSDERSELALANRILYSKHVLDAFGHVSVRSAARPDRFLLARNRAPALVEESDVQEFDLVGVTEDPRPVYLERFIHAAVYARRPDVGAIVHSHAPVVIPFTAPEVQLKPMTHVAGFLSRGVSKFDIRSVAGDGTDLLIRDLGLGESLADTLDSSSLVLMRGHGFVTVAPDLRQAVFQSVQLQVNAQIQLAAAALGADSSLSINEGLAAANSNATQVFRAWELWAREAGAGQ
ncbi:class II aldolase/adducin family protein [Subtercola sp. YIM 133946]|uniref:class II aldolase/adducin family protein n=1 Tax=Subtercola sp. YIM 133946 TaxID=3118909 RepID=UPI002F957D0C